MDKMSKYAGLIALWSWCAGSSRLTLNMMSLPFKRFVLFPVDLRYGWDIRLPSHQVLLQEVDALFCPKVTSFEPRCKYWSRCSQAATGRQQDHKLLHFIASHVCHLHEEQRGWIVEQPRDTTIFKDSPLAILDDLEYSSPIKSDCHRRTNFCSFSSEQDGLRVRKQTLLKSNFYLKQCIRPCRCKCGHLTLAGHASLGMGFTATVCVFPKEFCRQLCKDILNSSYFEDFQVISRDQISAKDFKKPVPEQIQDIDTSSLQLFGNVTYLVLDIPGLQQILKATMLEIMDQVLKFKSNTEAYVDILAENGMTPYPFLKHFFDKFSPHFGIKFSVVCSGQTSIPDFDKVRSQGAKSSGDAQEHQDRLVISAGIHTGQANGNFTESWRTGESVAVGAEHVVFTFLGKLTESGRKLLRNPPRRRLLQKTPDLVRQQIKTILQQQMRFGSIPEPRNVCKFSNHQLIYKTFRKSSFMQMKANVADFYKDCMNECGMHRQQTCSECCRPCFFRRISYHLGYRLPTSALNAENGSPGFTSQW